MKSNILLTQRQAADIFSISENTLNALAYSGQLPHMRMANTAGTVSQLYFNSEDLVNWYNVVLPTLNLDNKAHVVRIKRRINKQPKNLKMLKSIDTHFTIPRKVKGYSLAKVKNKKLGFVFYVRYIEKGKVLPRRSTHTNNFELATQFAIEKRDELVAEYFNKRIRKENDDRLFYIMKNYYKKDSKYQKSDTRRRPLTEISRKVYHGAILQHWIPFLKEKKIKSLEDIDAQIIINFQDYCMDKGMMPQSANHYVSFVSRIFDYLVIKKYVKYNPCISVPRLCVLEESKAIRECYNTDELYGIFKKRWSNEMHHLLCLMIYTTGMRNSEIDRIQIKDIVRVNKCWFINIPKSKTKHGTRMVPLHNFVYNKLLSYIKKSGKTSEDNLFCQANGGIIPRQWYTDSNIALGVFTKRSKEMLKKEGITYYSGRHWWKTVMNAYKLGEEVEEYFMGHKTSSDVAKNYNHRHKQGKNILEKKAREVFKILDKALFNKPKKKLVVKKAYKKIRRRKVA